MDREESLQHEPPIMNHKHFRKSKEINRGTPILSETPGSTGIPSEVGETSEVREFSQKRISCQSRRQLNSSRSSHASWEREQSFAGDAVGDPLHNGSMWSFTSDDLEGIFNRIFLNRHPPLSTNVQP